MRLPVGLSALTSLKHLDLHFNFLGAGTRRLRPRGWRRRNQENRDDDEAAAEEAATFGNGGAGVGASSSAGNGEGETVNGEPLPDDLCTGWGRVEFLSLHHNYLVRLPASMAPSMGALQRLNLHRNSLETLPDDFGDLTSLEWLEYVVCVSVAK